MNKLTIIGNLTGDPELRTTTSGKEVCAFNVAVNRRQKDQNGNSITDFFRVNAWNERAKVCKQYLAKGKKVCVIGPVSVHTYQTQNGEVRAQMDLLAEEVEFLTPKGDGYTQVNDPDDPFAR